MCQMEGRDISKRMLFTVLFSCVSSSSSSKTCAEGLASVPKENPEFCVQPFEAKIVEDGTAVSKQGQTPTSVCLVQGTHCVKDVERRKTDAVINYTNGRPADNTSIQTSSKMSVYWNLVKHSASGTCSTIREWEGCVSEHGVHDQLGNAWEWVDLGRTATRDEWVEYLAKQGVEKLINRGLHPQVRSTIKVSGILCDDGGTDHR